MKYTLSFLYGGPNMVKLLQGKNIVVMGVANERSIAWGITKSLHRAGANLIFTNRQERSRKKLVKLLEKHDIEAKLMVTCDVASDDSIASAFDEIKEKNTITSLTDTTFKQMRRFSVMLVGMTALAQDLTKSKIKSASFMGLYTLWHLLTEKICKLNMLIQRVKVSYSPRKSVPFHL